MNIHPTLGKALGYGGAAMAVGLPLGSLYTSGQENRGLIGTTLNATAAAGIGGALAYGGYKLGGPTMASDVAKKIAKGFM